MEQVTLTQAVEYLQWVGFKPFNVNFTAELMNVVRNDADEGIDQ